MSAPPFMQKGLAKNTIVDHICDLASKFAPNYDENKVYEAVLNNPL